MKYRSADIKKLCSICGEKAPFWCLRCGRPLCVEHMHVDDTRCAECEEHYATVLEPAAVERAAERKGGLMHLFAGPKRARQKAREEFLAELHRGEP